MLLVDGVMPALSVDDQYRRNEQGLKISHSSRTRSLGQPAVAARTDTNGNEFLPADPALTDLLKLHLPMRCFAHRTASRSFSADWRAALSTSAHGGRRHTPVLHQRDVGRDSQYIDIIRPNRELEKARSASSAFTHCRSEGHHGLPDNIPCRQHAFTFLFNQTEFGMGCRSTSPTAAQNS